MKRDLPTVEEAARILAAKRTRPSRRPPATAGRRLNRLVKTLDERYGQGAGGLKSHWREIAGAALSRTTEPVRLITPKAGGGATLEIRVGGPAAALIQHQVPQLLARANMYLGEGAVVKIRIVQGPVREAAAKPKTAPLRKRPPLDAAQEAALAEGVAKTGNEGLKNTLMKLGREVLRGRASSSAH